MVGSSDTTACSQSRPFRQLPAVPGILAAFSPECAVLADRAPIHSALVIGRSEDCGYVIRDDKISKRHCRISRTAEECRIEDMKSTNGTFLNGHPVVSSCFLKNGDVIRAGQSVLVFCDDISRLSAKYGQDLYGMEGPFHTPRIIETLREAAYSSRHVLLTGPSGAGKELAAKALLSMLDTTRDAPFIVHNAARFASEEEAAVTLFGVAPRFFSGVDGRAGLIEAASGGVLFLDEIHNLPVRTQRSVLRVIEDGQYSRVGETTPRTASVRFIFASNDPSEYRGLAHDLYARLRRVDIPALRERRADIPSIFRVVFANALAAAGLDAASVVQLLSGDHFESMLLDGFEDDNIRGIGQIVDLIVSALRNGGDPQATVARVFGDRYSDNPVVMRKHATEGGAAHYEMNREIIIAAYRECGKNLSATERLLKSRGMICCRRVLALYLEKWAVR